MFVNVALRDAYVSRPPIPARIVSAVTMQKDLRVEDLNAGGLLLVIVRGTRMKQRIRILDATLAMGSSSI